jgi:Pyruvate/2-oxoacid:ferredoxin oxidoreductase delta subunit
MLIDKELCTGCEICHPYCTVGAITTLNRDNTDVSEIDQNDCVECGVCLRAEVCPADAIFMPELDWPRSVRAAFSDPLTSHPSSNLKGRGTMEMKTNDLTGRFRRGEAGISVEMGRPNIGSSFRDIQRVSMALADMGVEFEPENPLSALIVDKTAGKIDEDILDEKVLSAIIEFKVGNDRLKDILTTLKDISNEINSVFSLGLISLVDEDGTVPTVSIAREAGFSPRPNTKTNMGLGRPLFKEG